ncbi:scopoletin glucosyltransferase-like [Salvia splendens]|uniref:scopoletin glucosyltransferase-like n=1 Tax=Salvia splendens TaxID=180675 RepID=UPI001C26F4CD|nr:scopoletin glucosyltransferase-like [Salvia splendens]
MAHGHMIPALDMAKLFTSRGLKTTIISTPSFSSPVLNAQAAGLDIGLVSIHFPPPPIIPICRTTSPASTNPVEDLLRQLNPNCLISDMFLPWTADSAAKFGIPRFVFHGTSYFSLCAAEELRRHKPFRGTDHFVLPNLPHREEMATTEVADFDLNEDDGTHEFLSNSFYELEPDYADHYRNALGRMAWKIDPLLLCNNAGGAGERGKKPSVDVAACVAWLDSKKVNSVVYVCFGSMAKFSPAQLKEIATISKPRKTFTVDTKGGIKASQLLINAIEILKQKLGVVRLSADTVEADEQFGELGPHMRRG